MLEIVEYIKILNGVAVIPVLEDRSWNFNWSILNPAGFIFIYILVHSQYNQLN